MSENLDLVRSLRAAWDHGDFSSSDWAHPELEYVIVDGRKSRHARGVPEMAECWREFLADWQAWQARTTEVRELDAERVLALVELSGRHRASGLDLGAIGSTSGANLFHVCEGRVTKFVLYLDREHALADLGLKE